MTEMLETPVVWCQGVDAPTVSVVVPTKNEAANIEPLVEALAHALAGLPAEVIFVDDSDDDTSERIRDVASVSMPRDLEIRLFERHGRQRSGGLSGAVLEGIAAARSSWVCVMDGDLQHPPDVVTDLLHAPLVAMSISSSHRGTNRRDPTPVSADGPASLSPRCAARPRAACSRARSRR